MHQIVIMQEHEKKLHLVVYANKKLTNAETKYSTLEKECLAIIWDIECFVFFSRKKVLLANDSALSIRLATKTTALSDGFTATTRYVASNSAVKPAS